jgi:hypothetical protein
VTEIERADVEAVVSPSGDLVISADDVHRLSLAPGQHVTVTITARPRRRSMYGALAGQVRDIDLDRLKRIRREVWGELANDR